MQLIDANVIIRYLLQDNVKLSPQATQIIENNDDIYATNEVLAEVVYVLMKVYGLPKTKIIEALQRLFAKNLLQHTQPIFIERALQLYADNTMDFVDCLLVAYHQNFGLAIVSFDKKVNKKIGKA